MTEPQQPKANNVTIEELDRALVAFKINRIDGIRTSLKERVAKAEAATDEAKVELEKELKTLQETDSKGDDTIQKALDEKIERLKKDLSVYEDKDNLENIKNIISITDVKIEHLRFFGV